MGFGDAGVETGSFAGFANDPVWRTKQINETGPKRLQLFYYPSDKGLSWEMRKRISHSPDPFSKDTWHSNSAGRRETCLTGETCEL
jgi:hypothetical protein